MYKKEVVKITSDYSKEVAKHFGNLKKVILFGSFAKNEANEWSDIDVAVIVDKIENKILESEFLLHKLVRNFDIRIEPQLFEEGNDPSGFLEEIYKTGIIVYQAA